jgi:LuxR family transcriptional regulator, quorum-sensing system regulator CciR
MAELHDIQTFIDLSSKASSFDDLKNLLHAISLDMGFDHFALVQHVDIRRPGKAVAVWLENYPSSWAEVFVEQALYASDPIHLASHRTNVAFAWSDVPSMIKMTAHHRRVLEAAGSEGMGDGCTVPAHVPGEANGSCSFAVKRGRELPQGILPMVQLVGSFAFQAGRQQALKTLAGNAHKDRPKLTPRQLDCLVLVARGKSDWEIAQILGLKEDTVTEHMEEARNRYDVKRRIQLVLRAVHDGHLALTDVLS